MFRDRRYGIKKIIVSDLSRLDILKFREEAIRSQPMNSPIRPAVDVQQIISRGIQRSKAQKRKINFGDMDV